MNYLYCNGCTIQVEIYQRLPIFIKKWRHIGKSVFIYYPNLISLGVDGMSVFLMDSFQNINFLISEL